MPVKLIADSELPELQARLYRFVEQERYVLELLLFGAAFSSRFILLRSKASLERLSRNDPAALAAIGKGGSSLGKILRPEQIRQAEDGLWLELDALP